MVLDARSASQVYYWLNKVKKRVGECFMKMQQRGSNTPGKVLFWLSTCPPTPMYEIDQQHGGVNGLKEQDPCSVFFCSLPAKSPRFMCHCSSWICIYLFFFNARRNAHTPHTLAFVSCTAAVASAIPCRITSRSQAHICTRISHRHCPPLYPDRPAQRMPPARLSVPVGCEIVGGGGGRGRKRRPKLAVPGRGGPNAGGICAFRRAQEKQEVNTDSGMQRHKNEENSILVFSPLVSSASCITRSNKVSVSLIYLYLIYYV